MNEILKKEETIELKGQKKWSQTHYRKRIKAGMCAKNGCKEKAGTTIFCIEHRKERKKYNKAYRRRKCHMKSEID